MIWNFCQNWPFLRLGKFLLSACIQNGMPKYLTDWFQWKFGCKFFIFEFVIKSIENTSKIIYLCQNGQFMRTGISCQLNKKNCATEIQVTVRLISCKWLLLNSQYMWLQKLLKKCLYFIQRPYIFRNIFSPILHVFDSIIEIIIPPKEHFKSSQKDIRKVLKLVSKSL